jgi:hypothetical protein
MKWTIMTIAAALLMTTAVHAGSNFCEGTVKVGSDWTTVVANDDTENGCRFKTSSKLGSRILATCPNGAECRIELPSEPSSPTSPKSYSWIARNERRSRRAQRRAVHDESLNAIDAGVP